MMDETEFLTIIQEFQELSTQILGERNLEKRKEAQLKMKALANKAREYETQVGITELLNSCKINRN
jgi:hypothetical protein